ncbi:MAG: Ig-like domain-containing protein, partial [Bacteroidota bacterium]
MNNTFFPKSYLLYYIILVFLFQKCAQIVPLTGGKKDTSAPQLLSVHPPNYSKNFLEKKIIFSFNEKIQLINPYTNIILIPQSNKNLEWKIKNKTLEIVLPDSLQPNTTYRIILNKTIADLTEKNTLDNYEYIFSTGNFIDSFYIKGNVKDAYTLSNQKTVLIALYNEPANDSIILKEKPFYFTKTNDDGNFIIKNLPNRKLKAFAYSDNNNNFNYDPIKEKIDLYPYLVNPDKDRILNFLIAEEQPNRNNIKKIQVINPYLIHVIYSYPDKYELLQNDKNIFLINDSTYSDTCKILVHSIDTAKIIIKNSTQTDTIKIPISKKSSQKLQYTQLHQFNNQQPFYSPIILQSNFWIDTNVVKKEIQFFNQSDTIHSIPLNNHLKPFPHQIIINYPLQQN